MKPFILALAFSVLACGASAPTSFVTKAPVKKEFCPKDREQNPLWLNLHPECRKFTA
jgi:hypothetical protein